MRHRVRDGCNQLPGRGLSHVMPGNADGGKGRLDNSCFGDIVKADDSNVLRQPVSPELERLHGPYGDQIIIGKITFRQFILPVDDFQHVRKSPLDTGREPVDDTLGGRHPVRLYRLVEAVLAFIKIAQSVGGAEVTGLFPQAADEIIRGRISWVLLINTQLQFSDSK